MMAYDIVYSGNEIYYTKLYEKSQAQTPTKSEHLQNRENKDGSSGVLINGSNIVTPPPPKKSTDTNTESIIFSVGKE